MLESDDLILPRNDVFYENGYLCDKMFNSSINKIACLLILLSLPIYHKSVCIKFYNLSNTKVLDFAIISPGNGGKYRPYHYLQMVVISFFFFLLKLPNYSFIISELF